MLLTLMARGAAYASAPRGAPRAYAWQSRQKEHALRVFFADGASARQRCLIREPDAAERDLLMVMRMEIRHARISETAPYGAR